MTKTLQTVAAMACMKSFLMIFNIAFWATGLVVLCAGIWMQVELHRYLELNSDFSNKTPYVLVATGALILFIGTLACCCTVKGQPSLLYLYGTFLLIIFFIEIALTVSIYTYKDTLSNGFDKGLNKSLQQYGDDITLSTDFDLMQSKLKCCGNHGYQDWNNLRPSMPVPRSCCQRSRCDVQDESQIYTTGCYDKVVQLINSNMSMIGGCAIGVTFFPLIGILLSFCLARNVNKAKYEQMA